MVLEFGTVRGSAGIDKVKYRDEGPWEEKQSDKCDNPHRDGFLLGFLC